MVMLVIPDPQIQTKEKENEESFGSTLRYRVNISIGHFHELCG
jgi:hypothetical protein